MLHDPFPRIESQRATGENRLFLDSNRSVVDCWLINVRHDFHFVERFKAYRESSGLTSGGFST
jgi:hypothetical protein